MHVKQGFFHFLPNLIIFKYDAQRRCCRTRTLKNHQIWQKKFGKKCRKALFDLLSSWQVPDIRMSGTHSATNMQNTINFSHRWKQEYSLLVKKCLCHHSVLQISDLRKKSQLNYCYYEFEPYFLCDQYIISRSYYFIFPVVVPFDSIL